MPSIRSKIVGARFSRSQEEALLDILDTGSVTPSGLQEITGAGAIDIVTYKTEITTDSADAFTLADGVVGQRKLVHGVDVAAGDATITPTNLMNGTTVVLSEDDDVVEFEFIGTEWRVVHMDSALGTGVTPVLA